MRHGVAICLLAAGGVLAATTVGTAKPRRVSSKGATYAFEVSPAGAAEREYLLLEPGRDFWLVSAMQYGGRPCVRTGTGAQWSLYLDTRVPVVAGFLYFEKVPLAGRPFEEAARAFQGDLPALWDRHQIDLRQTISAEPVKRMEVAGSAVPGLRILQDVMRRDNRWQRGAETLLFPWGGDLVALTSYGVTEAAAAMLRIARVAPAGSWGKPQTSYVADAGGSPIRVAFFVAALPPGYRYVPVPGDLSDVRLVAEWERPGAVGEPALATLTLRRIQRGDPPRLEPALNELLDDLRGKGWQVEAPAALPVDGHSGLACDCTHPGLGETPAQAGWVVAWAEPTAAYCLRWQSREAGDVVPRKAEVARTVTGLQTWTSDPQR